MGNKAFRDCRLPNCFPCAVCGTETNLYADWFLVVENRWLDHLSIFSWHPVLAAQKDVLGVCGQNHLKMLVTHWLTQANLEFQRGRDLVAPIPGKSRVETEPGPLSADCLLGELAVHRESSSRVWSGSRESLECILNAVIGGGEPSAPTLHSSVCDQPHDSYRELALQ